MPTGFMFGGPLGDKMNKVALAVLALIALTLAVNVVGMMMRFKTIAPAHTITISGEGEALAVPDIALFTFSVVSLKATVAEAQNDNATKINAVTAYLKEAKIDAKDIQTSDYSVNPQYEYQTAVCPQVSYSPTGGTSYCPGGKQVLKGYEVRQTTTVKIRDTAKAGDMLSGVGAKGATEVSGLTFTVDELDAVKEEARAKAVADARAKAEKLARSLGVSLGSVVSFDESGSGMYARPMAYDAVSSMAGKAVAPEISVGQSKITSNVSVTFEIR